MKEEFISYLWKNCLLKHDLLYTTEDEDVTVISPGFLNSHAGPDFTAAKIRIGSTLWVGNVEIHVLASDWNRHGHQKDKQYDNIILHIVFQADITVFNSQGICPPTLEIKNRFDPALLNNYLGLKKARSWIACQHSIHNTDPLIWQNLLTRLLIDRLELKTQEAAQFFMYFQRDWENTLYFLLARNFGFKVNATPMGLLAQKTPWPMLKKAKHAIHLVEAILFGQSGLLATANADDYTRKLSEEYHHQKRKFSLESVNPAIWKFARMRPVNFPTIRIAQFARFLYQSDHLFSQLIRSYDLKNIKKSLDATASHYWDTHYMFGTISGNVQKKIGEESIHNIIINTVSPLIFLYGKETSDQTAKDFAIHLLQTLPAENNNITRKWQQIGIIARSAADGQALIELKKNHCIPKKCLDCHVGFQIMNAPR